MQTVRAASGRVARTGPILLGYGVYRRRWRRGLGAAFRRVWDWDTPSW